MIKQVSKGMKALVYFGLISITVLCYKTNLYAVNDIPICEEYFPDSRFRAYVAENLDPNHDGILTSDEIAGVTEINYVGDNNGRASLNPPQPEDMMNVKGLEFFTNLQSLTISQADIDKIDVSIYKDLTYLNVSYNYLTSLDVSSNTALKELNCRANWLDQIDVTNNKSLEVLEIVSNRISTLDISNNPSLQVLSLGANLLSTIDLSKCPNLRVFGCGSTKIERVNIGHNPLLCLAVSAGLVYNVDHGKAYGCTGPNGEVCSLSFYDKLDIIEVPYNDVFTDMWSYQAIKYAFNNHCMVGVGNDTFAPQGVVTRAQFVQILYNIEGKPPVTPTDQFIDVLSNQWYSDAVAWAAKNQITSGISENEFGTNLPITREQMITLFYKYGKTKENYKRQMYPDRLKYYKDAEQISPWAVEAVTWSISNNVVTGIMSEYGHEQSGSIDPRGPATREQCAQIVRNMLMNGPDPLYNYGSN